MPSAALFELGSLALLFVILIVAAFTDITRRKVYDWTTVPAIAFGLALGYAAGDVGQVHADGAASFGLLSHLAGFGVALALLTLFYLAGGLGGGDVKLMAAVGAIGGYPFVLGAMFWSSLVGAVIAVWVILWRGRLLEYLRRAAVYGFTLRGLRDPALAFDGDGGDGPASNAPNGGALAEDPARLRIPYGVAISFGTMAWTFMELART